MKHQNLVNQTLGLEFFRKHLKVSDKQRNNDLFLYIFSKIWEKFIVSITRGKIIDCKYVGYLDSQLANMNSGVLLLVDNIPVIISLGERNLQEEADALDSWAGKYPELVTLPVVEIPILIFSSEAGKENFIKMFSNFISNSDANSIKLEAKNMLIENDKNRKSLGCVWEEIHFHNLIQILKRKYGTTQKVFINQSREVKTIRFWKSFLKIYDLQ